MASNMASRSPTTVRRPSTTSSQESRGSNETYESMSTAPSSVHGHSPQCPKEPTGSWSRPPPPTHLAPPQPQIRFQSSTTAASEDISPCTSLCPRDSVDTYDSRIDSDMEDEEEDDLVDDDGDITLDDDESSAPRKKPGASAGWAPRIPVLPTYLRQPEHDVIPSNPQAFARLFPSMDRLLIRHDDLTPDGNMNLRVDTVVPGSGRRRQSSTVQLFHLRMHDLARREFSLRRYCRDSGREVCKSKRKFTTASGNRASSSSSSLCADNATQTTEARRPSLTRSVSSALKVLAPRPGNPSRRPSAASVLFGGVGRSSTGSSYEADDESTALSTDNHKSAPLPPPVPTNTIKLEFSNYARVDVSRCGARGSKRYEFEWWGHTYAWKRVVDRNVEGVVSFHLIRDGQGAPVAHIVPEMRTPTQVRDEEGAGGWIPPCYMWISDPSIIEAVTDVADVIVATGLMALVDDCIKERWQDGNKKPKPRRPSAFGTLDVGNPKSIMQHFFGGRRHSDQPTSPLRIVDSTY
jgi:hypothetical protein